MNSMELSKAERNGCRLIALALLVFWGSVACWAVYVVAGWVNG